MDIFISSKDYKRLPELEFDFICGCSKRIGAVVADYGDHLHIIVHPCKVCGGKHEPYEEVKILDMYPNTGKTSFELFEEHKKEWEKEDD